MNHIYSRVWSHTLGAWVVASELAPRRGKAAGRGARAIVLSVLASAILPAMAQTVAVDERETTGDFERGVEIHANADNDPIHLTSGNVTTTGRYADGIFVNAWDDADAVVQSGSVTVSGEGANGLLVFAGTGDVVIRSGTAHSLYAGAYPADNDQYGLLYGSAGAAVWGSSVYGNVSVTSGEAMTLAENAWAVGAQTGWQVTDTTGTVHLSSGRASTAGDRAAGLYAHTTGTGKVTVASGSVETAGYGSHAIWAQSVGGAVEVDSGIVRTLGYRAFAVAAQGQGDIVVRSEEAVTQGELSHAILTWSGAGTIDIDSGVVATSGDSAAGIRALAAGDIRVYSGMAQTGGQASYGIHAASDEGMVEIESGAVATAGEQATGILVASGSRARVQSGEVSTSGDFADGIAVDGIADGGSITVDSGSVTTGGRFADGIRVTGGTAGIAVTSDRVSISGAGANGILVLSGAADIVVDSGTVELTYAGPLPEDNAEHGDLDGIVSGVWASSSLGSVQVSSGSAATVGDNAYGVGADTGWGVTDGTGTTTVVSGTVTTAGLGAYGIYANTTGSGTVSVDSGLARTTGDYSIAVFARSTGSADVRVRSDDAQGAGYNSHGVYAVSAGGSVEVDSGTVATAGDFAYGILARGAQGATVRSESVATTGGYGVFTATGEVVGAYGIRAEGGAGAVVVDSGSVSTAGELATAILVVNGSKATVDSDTIATTGDYANGIQIGGIAAGGSIAVTSGSIRTSGRESRGLFVDNAQVDSVSITSDEVQVASGTGILVFAGARTDVRSGDVKVGHGTGLHVSTTGDVTVASGIVAVEYGSSGISASGRGAVSVASEEVKVSGDSVVGISARSSGDVTIDSGVVRASGLRGAVGISASSDADVRIRSDLVEVGAGISATGISASSHSGDVHVATGKVYASDMAVSAGSLYGDVAIDVDGDLRAHGAWTISANADKGKVEIEVASGQVVTGGIRTYTRNGTRIDIYGEVVAGSGGALLLQGGAATINNYSNTIIGAIQLTDEDDVFNNVGTWVAGGISDFGAGNDILSNSGLVQATGSGTTTIANLTTFVNEGVLDMANGQSGDRLEMADTTLVGGNGSSIRVDVDFATGASDALAVQAVEGRSVVQINNIASGPGFNFGGLSIIESERAMNGNELTLDMGQSGAGLVDYQLAFDPASNRFVVKALPGSASFELIKAGAAAQDFWARSGDAWAARMVAARDGFAAGAARSGGGVWVQGHAGGLDFQNSGTFDLGGGSVTQDMSTESGWNGVQAGLDRTWSHEAGGALLGVTAGYTRYSLDFSSSSGRYGLDGANLGLYGAIERGRFFAQGLAKADRFGGDLRTSQAGVAGDIDGAAYGARIEAGVRFGGRFWVEPLVGANWVKARVDEFRAGTVEAEFDDATSVQTLAGVRFGGSTTSGGATVVPSLGLYAVDERRGENGTVLWLGGQGHHAEDTPHGNYARAEASLTLATGGVEVFVRGGADFGSGTDGFNARAGLRWSW